MGLGFDIGNILQQYGNINPNEPPRKVEQDFDEIAQHTPNEALADGLSAAFRSDQTPPFGAMVGQLFGQADPQQRSGMLGQLLGALGPSAIGSLLGGGMGGGALGGLLNRVAGQQSADVRPEDVENLSPDEVQELAARAEQQNPGIVDQMSRFYAQNPTLVKALGGAALAIALGQMSQRRR
ncbi:hypothetical protein Q8A64_04340 [Oxalobacteraceae bacterium R-40]|uniref:DUF937 domain-containing protein n=1 Tax=Keguizhuia sedimenti TaxID=3064264 RepID=A0ABU1BMI9_9BURK|nr:hypothetical protein [Oxalobacteraceae bacterium R-40]